MSSFFSFAVSTHLCAFVLLFQIRWSNRKKHGALQNRYCMVTVDGTDFRIQEPSPFSPAWYSHKYKGPGVRYEVALSINGGDIVWINGPFACGRWPDLRIFRQKLIHKLEHGEMIEANKGYRGEPLHARTPVDYLNIRERRRKCRARARQETVNRRFKQFGILSQRYRHDLRTHRIVFEAIVVLTQMDFNNGNRLFGVRYR